MAERINAFFNFTLASVILNRAQHQRKTIIANMPICTHLSNHIFSSQFSFGKAVPGMVNKMIEIINQITG